MIKRAFVLLTLCAIDTATGQDERVIRRYSVQVTGGVDRVEVVSRAYKRQAGVSAREQLGIQGVDPSKLPGKTLDATKIIPQTQFTTIPGVPNGQAGATSRITPAKPRTVVEGEKICVYYRDELIAEIPGNPRFGMNLSGYDHGWANPVVDKVIAISGHHLVVIVEEKSYGGMDADRVYTAKRKTEGAWLVTQLVAGAGGTSVEREAGKAANKGAEVKRGKRRR